MNNAKNNNANVNRKGRRAGILAGLFAGIGGLQMLGWLGFIGLGVSVAIGYGVFKAVTVMASGLDTTTHNREDREKEEQQRTIASIQPTGNNDADDIVEKGRQMLRQIYEANDAIPDARLTHQLNELSRLCTQIFRTVSEHPEKAPRVRKFMNYYLPTTLKMLNNYRMMQDRGVSSGALYEMRQTLSRGLDMVLTACQKQLDNLYKDNVLDVSTDIDVLEQMLKRDGLMDDDTGTLNTNARSAAAQQLQTGTPVVEEHSAPTLQESFDELAAQYRNDYSK